MAWAVEPEPELVLERVLEPETTIITITTTTTEGVDAGDEVQLLSTRRQLILQWKCVSKRSQVKWRDFTIFFQFW